jgi:hypothetical protein
MVIADYTLNAVLLDKGYLVLLNYAYCWDGEMLLLLSSGILGLSGSHGWMLMNTEERMTKGLVTLFPTLTSHSLVD